MDENNIIYNYKVNSFVIPNEKLVWGVVVVFGCIKRHESYINRNHFSYLGQYSGN